jgi:O-succinylbenzoic acid--CoA ligase
VTARLRLATGTAEVLASLRRSLAGDEVTAPLPPTGREREQTLTMLQPQRPVSEPDAAAIVATSGSTGRPRGVVLSRGALIASAAATHRRLEGGGTWVLALPPHYVAGLMVLVRSLVADRPVHEVDGRLQGLTELDLGAGPAYLSLVPTQLARAITDPDLVRALTRFDAVLLGGAAADPDLLERAARAGIDVVTGYGMSETCGGCVYDGLPLDGVEVRTGRAGRISISGPMLFAGYRLDPEATADVLVDGRLLTSDRGQWSGGRLTVLGRLDDVVISGGMNVDLAVVERAVRASTGCEAAVVGLPHSEWGTEVVAVVELSENPPPAASRPRGPDSPWATWGGFPEASIARLRTALIATLPSYALPRRLVVTQALPRTSGGKIDRRRLVFDLARRSPENP